MAWGYHLILDCKSCDKDVITNKEKLTNFSNELVRAIRMKKYGEPILEHFAAHDEAAAGYTLVQLIETSNITGHFSDLTGDVYLDIFSCKYFDRDEAMAVVSNLLSPQTIKAKFIERQA